MRNIRRRVPRKLPPQPRAPREWCPGGGAPDQALTDRARKHPFLRSPKYSLARGGDQRAAHKLQIRWHVRCPECGRRLRPQMQLQCFQEEFTHFAVPDHMRT